MAARAKRDNMIEAATCSVEKTLSDQSFVDAEVFDSIVEAISQPAKPHPELAKLLKNSSEWATSDS
jgi:uncharacterized protein (DUF1778 family)